MASAATYHFARKETLESAIITSWVRHSIAYQSGDWLKMGKSFLLRIFNKCSIVTVKGKAAPAEVTHAVNGFLSHLRTRHSGHNPCLRLWVR
jgi:hypothetical protein